MFGAHGWGCMVGVHGWGATLVCQIAATSGSSDDALQLLTTIPKRSILETLHRKQVACHELESPDDIYDKYVTHLYAVLLVGYLEKRHLCSDICWQPLQLPELPLGACIICTNRTQNSVGALPRITAGPRVGSGRV